MDESQEGAGASSKQPSPPASAPAPGKLRMRRVAAAICALEALVLLGFCAFYLWELAQGASADAMRAAMSTLLIAVFAVGLGLLARAWRAGANWPNTPTVVWNLLLLPVAWSLVQGGHGLVGAAVALCAVVGVVAAIGGSTSEG